MAEASLTRRGVLASSLIVAGALAAAASAAPAGGFDAALTEFDASLAALNAAPDDDEELWNRLGDAHADAAKRLAELPAPDLGRFRAKMERVVGYYSHRDTCMIEDGNAARLIKDLARLVPA